MKQKGFAPIIILALIVLGVVGYFAYQNYLAPKGSALGPYTPQQTSTPESTANWKTYTNTKYGFSFKYPEDLKLSSDLHAPDSYTIRNSSTFIAFNVEDTCLNTQCLTTQSLDEIADNISLDVLSSFKIGKSNGVKIKNGFMLEIPNSNKFLLLNSGQHTPIVDQILSTFKFLDQTSVNPVITSPFSNTKVSSPLTITGTVPSGWMFEGVFPIKLVDSQKNIIVQDQAKEKVPGSWQSGNSVAFTATLTFTTDAKSGTLILENDNPSGDPANSKTFEVPVNF